MGTFKIVHSVSSGKEIKMASKNSVANHYSHCLDSFILAGPDSIRFWPRDRRKTCAPPGLIPPRSINHRRWDGFGFYWRRFKLSGLKKR